MSDTQKKKKPNVPNLRFRGFEGEWKRNKLSMYLYENKERNRFGEFNKADVLSVSGDYGIINQIELLGRSFAGKSVTDYHVVRAGDVVYTKSPLKEYPYGIVKYNNGEDGIVSTLYAVYHLMDNADGRFIEYYFTNPQRTNRYFKPIVRIGAKHDMKIGNAEVLDNYVVFPVLTEQRRITKMLSLLDERIVIQNKVIEKYESLIKALRHHFFSAIEPVREVSFADVLSYEQPSKYIVSDTEYSDNKGLTPVLTANKAFILGYTEEVEGIYDKGPCIILDDFTLDSKIVGFPFKVKSSAIKILSAKTTVSLRYIFEYLKFLDLNTEEHKRHYIAEIESMTIGLPEDGTIQSIASLFDLLDQRRKVLERDQQLLNSQKDYLIRALFI